MLFISSAYSDVNVIVPFPFYLCNNRATGVEKVPIRRLNENLEMSLDVRIGSPVC